MGDDKVIVSADGTRRLVLRHIAEGVIVFSEEELRPADQELIEAGSREPYWMPVSTSQNYASVERAEAEAREAIDWLRGWPRGWTPINDSEHRRIFREELASELGEGHILKTMQLEPIARADAGDDYLYLAEDGRVVQIHLTFANRPERPPWPSAMLFQSLGAWRAATDSADP